MSGFIAIVNTNGSPVARGLLEKLTASLHFKGPDRQQIWVDGSVGLGHTLFRTTDEAQYEKQPASLDGKVWITGSIRIDGRKELVNKLGISKEIKLSQTPDSELVLHAYRTWGERCMDHLLGDFAFAIWDGYKRQLFCAKDRFGMRQLYYAHKKNVLVISNSLHGMLSHPEISKHLNDRAIGGFLLFGNHTWLDKSISAFADVNVILPAHWLSLRNGKLKSQKYWDLPIDTPLLNYRNERDYIEHFQDVFLTAVSDRIRTATIVVSMSGGMDSSAVAAIAQEVINQKYQSPELNATTVIYKKMYLCEEHYYASLVAAKLGLPVHYTSGDNFPLLTQWFQTTQPVENGQLGLWLDFERSQHKLGRVVLTGSSADNLFHYPSTSMALKESNIVSILVDIIKSIRRYGLMPGLGTGLRGKLKSLSSKNQASYSPPFPFPSWLNPDFEEKVLLKEQWDEMWEPLNKQAYKQSRYSLLKKSLLRPDWTNEDIVMTSDFTLSEKLDPYHDLRMVDFVLSLPALPWLFNKDILRRSMQEKLPAVVISRPKTPLGSVHPSVWKQAESQWVDEWQAHSELHQYIVRTKIPSLTGENYDPLASYVNLRPLLLNKWLEQIKNT